MITAKSQKVTTVSTPTSRTTELATFFILTYVLSFLTWGMLIIFKMPVANPSNPTAQTSALAMFLYMLGGFVPSIAGLIMAYRVNGRAGLRDMWKRFTQFNLGFKWYLLIIAIPVLIQTGSALIFKLQGGEFVRPALLDQPASLIPIIISILIGGPISEEFGWRGFAQDRVQERWGKLKGSFILGFVWSFWHSLLFWVPGAGQQETGNLVVMVPFMIMATVMAVFMTTVYNNTNRSIWGAIFFHFIANLGANVLLTISEASPAFVYTTNSVMWVVLFVAVFLIPWGNKKSEA